MKHFMQSEAWAAFQRSQGNKVVMREGDGWSYLAVEEVQVFGPARTKRLYTPYGPSFESLDALESSLASLEDLARREGSVFVRVEPMGPDAEAERGASELLQRRGYRRAAHMLPETLRTSRCSPTSCIRSRTATG